MRLAAQPHERIDRSQEIRFFYEGQAVRGFAGDTIGSALYRGRPADLLPQLQVPPPRGLICCTGHCPNCLMTVDGIPNVRVCVTPLTADTAVQGPERPRLARARLDGRDRQVRRRGSRRPASTTRRSSARGASGRSTRSFSGMPQASDELDPDAARTERYDVEHRHVRPARDRRWPCGPRGCDRRGRARRAGRPRRRGPRAGRRRCLSEPGGAAEARALVARARRAGVEVFSPASAIGIYEGGLVPVEYGRVLIRFRADHVVGATGTTDQPFVFPGNDLVGVMLPSAVRRLVNYWSLKPGERAVVLAVDDRGLGAIEDLRRGGVSIAELVDFRERRPRSISVKGRKGHVRQITVDGKSIDCDLVVMAGSPQPAYQLLAGAGATVEFDADRGIFVPTDAACRPVSGRVRRRGARRGRRRRRPCSERERRRPSSATARTRRRRI